MEDFEFGVGVGSSDWAQLSTESRDDAESQPVTSYYSSNGLFDQELLQPHQWHLAVSSTTTTPPPIHGSFGDAGPVVRPPLWASAVFHDETQASTSILVTPNDTLIQPSQQVSHTDNFLTIQHYNAFNLDHETTLRSQQDNGVEHNQTRSANSVRSRREHSKQYICFECFKFFQYPKDLERHERCIHTSDRPFICPHASCKYHFKGFKRKDALKRHDQKVHLFSARTGEGEGGPAAFGMAK